MKIADRLLAEGKLSHEAYQTATSYVSIHGGRVEDSILENGLMSEPDLLRFISTSHGTRFVSTEKLYKAVFEAGLLAMVPRKLADQHGVFPVLFDGQRVLSVVTADPDNLSALGEVKIASGVRDVVALVARPAAIRAAIQRGYHNDISGFVNLMTTNKKVELALDPSNGRYAPTVRGGLSLPPAAPSPQIDPGLSFNTRGTTGPRPQFDSSPHNWRGNGNDTGPSPLQRSDQRSSQEPALPPPPPQSVTLSTEYIETLNVLVSLLENSRPDLRGHSAQVARLVRRFAEKMELDPLAIGAMVVAAYFHDLGKAGTYHLTALNVAEYDGHKSAAVKVQTAPERFLQAVALHPDTKAAVAAMYERWDGKGLPSGLAGKDIPFGARLIAVADTYADLTTNPRNPARRILKPGEAVQLLTKYKGTVFDPSIVDVVAAEVVGEDLRAKLLANRWTVLLVDPDPEETMVLELRLLEAGFDVRIARSSAQALHELSTREVHAVVSEVDLDQPDGGLSLRGSAANAPWRDNVLAWIMHTRRTDRQLAEIVFDLGVDDLVAKPTPPDIFVTKLRQLIERKQKRAAATAAPRGVSGSLVEMGLPELVQVLWHGRKSGTVRISAKKGSGDIGFSEGQIFDARFATTRGEDAFYMMLALTEGDFQIDPTALPTERTINVSPEGLLLEGMRRIDEGLVG